MRAVSPDAVEAMSVPSATRQMPALAIAERPQHRARDHRTERGARQRERGHIDNNDAALGSGQGLAAKDLPA